jgi:integrase
MSVRKDKHKGTWIVDITKGKHPITGKPNRIIKRNITTRREALELEQHLKVTKLGNTPSPKDITIKMLYEMMVEEDKRNHRKASYMATQEYNYNKHIKGYFAKADIENLTKKELEDFRSSLSGKGLSNNTVNKQMILLRKLLGMAVSLGVLTKNPCKELKKLPVVRQKMSYWTPEEFHEFMTLFSPEERAYQLFFETAYFTGMRVGELLALTWEDIDLRREELEVTKTLVNLKGRTVINSPKTSSGVRTITLPTKLVVKLADWKAQQKELLTSYVSNSEKLQVFQFVPNLLTRHMVSKKYNTVVERSSTLKRIRIHDFRHSHVALLIDNKETPYIIKERLGHTSITTTLDIYGHLFPNKQKALSDRLDSFF